MKKVLIILLLVTMPVFAQNYEVSAGTVISEDRDMKAGYLIGLNFIIKTDQNRKYLNNLILGIEHSAFMSNNIVIGSSQKATKIKNNCNCEFSDISSLNSEAYILKKEVRAVSLLIGVSVTEGWYLFSGVTNYQHITLIDGNKANEYRTMHIDAGTKYFWKINKGFLTTAFKFNPETFSFSLGYSR